MDTIRASEPQPFAFHTIADARTALLAHMYSSEDRGLHELRLLSATMGALAYALLESADIADPRISEAWFYLSDQLADAAGAIETWNERAWLLSIIVAENDLDALASGKRQTEDTLRLGCTSADSAPPAVWMRVPTAGGAPPGTSWL